MKGLIVGASLGLGGIEAVLTDEEFNILESQERPFPGQLGKESIAVKVEKAITSLPAYHNASAVGIAIPAIFEDNGKKISRSTIEQLKDANFYQLMSKRISLPIFIFRRNFCSLLAEQAFGAAKSAKNAVLVEIGRDIAASFSVNGKIYRGANGEAGEIADVIVDITREKRNQTGGFGSLVSGEGIAALTGKSVYQILKENPDSKLLNQQIVRDLKESLLTGLYNVKLILDPELFIISGDILENYALFKTAFADLGVKIERSNLGKTSTALGAAIAAYNQSNKQNR
jgi:glucokinase